MKPSELKRARGWAVAAGTAVRGGAGLQVYLKVEPVGTAGVFF